MNKIAGAFDTFLRVVLAVALVVTFTPVSRDAAYADGVDELQLGAAGSKGEGTQTRPGKENSSTLSDSDETAEHGGSALPEGGSSSNETVSEEQAVVGGIESELAAPVASQASTPPGQGLVSWAKLMPNGYIYECDSEGELLEPIDEEKPSKNSVNSWAVIDLSSIGA